MICKCSSKDFVGNSHCPTCCESFAGDGWFDAHIVYKRGVGVVAHLNPVDMGLTLTYRGWGAGTRDPQAVKAIRKRIKRLREQIS